MRERKKTKIKCPFCGYQKQVEVHPVFLNRLWKVECEKCHKCFGVTFTFE